MSASIGTLVDRLHQIATLVSAEPTSTTDGAARVQEAGWHRLSRQLERALVALPFDQTNLGHQIRHVTVTALRAIGEATAPHAGAEASGHLAEAALVVGALADLLTSRRAPFRVDAQPAWLPASDARPRRWSEAAFDPLFVDRRPDDASANGLQSSLLAATHLLAGWSVRQTRDDTSPALVPLLSQLGVLAEPHLWMAPAHRGSALESVTATPWSEVSLLGAVQRWAHEAELALRRRLVTSGTFAMLASDLSILDATILHAFTTHERPGHRDVQDALGQARAGWKAIAQWPAHLRLGGAAATEFIRTSREVRAAIAADFRGPDGWFTPTELNQLHDSQSLDAIAHTLAGHATWVGDALAKTIRDMTWGSERLWVDREELRRLAPGYEPMRLFAQPDGARPVIREVHWLVPHQPVPAAKGIADAATNAARHQQRAEQQLDQVLGTSASPETVPALTVADRRVRAHATQQQTGRDVPHNPPI